MYAIRQYSWVSGYWITFPDTYSSIVDACTALNVILTNEQFEIAIYNVLKSTYSAFDEDSTDALRYGIAGKSGSF